MTYRGGQRSSKQAPSPKNPFQAIMNLIGRSAEAGERRVVPIMSDQLPPGAYMKETGEVIGMSSEQVPKGGYMTETGRVYVPAGFTGFSSESKQGPDVPDRIRSAPRPSILPSTLAVGATPIIRGTVDGVTPDRTQSDEYKAQMAQYGALQKAKKFDEAEKLGMEIWQQKYGKTAMAQPGGAVGARNPLMEATFGYQKGASAAEPSYATSASQVQPVGSVDFAVAANAVPAPWNQQGAKVSADFAGVVPFQAAKTTGEGMPAFQTTGEKAAEFLTKMKMGRVF